MGLIRAAVGAVGGTMADQWREFFYCEAMDADTTQSGSKIRLRGKGIVSMKNPQVHGDHYVTVQVQVPRNITPEARRKLREFEQACGIRNSYAG